MSVLVTSSDKQFVIRRGTKADCPVILDFINQLAEYEKEPDAVKATVSTLEQNVFDKNYAEVIIAEQHDSSSVTPVGMALYFYSFSTWTSKPSLYLEDLFVIPTLRNKGVGKLLFKALGQVAEQKDCARMDWSVLTWNAPSIAFYTKVLGAKPMDEWKGMRLEQKGIQDLAKLI
ncbi:acetyltransferase [Pseudozyma hubeiensis SY62]|uniref:Acetyltransferase n=1 Tax=Pseudozyma hubeiensis (strain SY62) TaxID=1305764 RepID=R9P4T1_PSEHS|nr:acetyltransferase [Pseudozyma hubeiensis SY62]GAC96443.1 acetyltransferase [Pseudozyma hubeiensis SY62]